jgi:sec-independent protein translocase protein TatA
MPNIGPMEIAIVLIIALIVFGPKRLPELGKSLGKGIQEFKGTISGEKPEPEVTPAVEQVPVAVAPGQLAEPSATAKTTQV